MKICSEFDMTRDVESYGHNLFVDNYPTILKYPANIADVFFNKANQQQHVVLLYHSHERKWI